MFITRCLQIPELFRTFKQKIDVFFEQSFGSLSKQDVFVGLMLSSFMINILGLVLPFIIIQMYDRVIPNKAYNTFAAFMIILLIVLIVEAALKILRGYVSASLDTRLGYSISVYAYKRAINANLTDFERDPFGIQVERFNLINSLKEYYSGQYLIALCDAPFVIVYFVFFYCVQIYIGLTVTTICLLLLAWSWLQTSKLKQVQIQKNKGSQIVSKFLIELLEGVGTIKAIGLEEQMLGRYERLQKNHVKEEFKFIQERMSSSKNINVVSQIMVMFTVIVGCYTIFKNYMSLGGMAACILLAGKVMQPVSSLVMLISKWKGFNVADQEFNKLINIKLENPYYGLKDSSLKKIDITKGEIFLNNVSFYHIDRNGNKITIFDKIQMNIPAKKVVAIHGEKLSGKSTLINILACLFKPEGNMLVDGEDINSINLDYVRKQIAIISQHDLIFQGSIWENLTRFSEMDVKIVQQVCMEIGLHTIIQAMPNGYQTIIGTDEALTKGVKQLIIIARELLKNPKIILFDEANMDLELETDLVLRKLLNLNKGHITMVIVSDRPSLLSMADQHYLIKDRMVVNMELHGK